VHVLDPGGFERGGGRQQALLFANGLLDAPGPFRGFNRRRGDRLLA
jgi:hypothetical protein